MRNKISNARFWMILCLMNVTLFGLVDAASAQNGKRVTGNVVDDTKLPLIGANVLVVGTTNGVITDLDGNFVITVSPDAKQLQISYVGYVTQTVDIPADGQLKIELKSDSQMLSDVVVIGYGTTRKSDLTGSVSNVSAKDFNSGPIASPEQLINGKVSGVQIMSAGGSPTVRALSVSVAVLRLMLQTTP